MSRRFVSWILAALLVGLAFVPLKSRDCPAWDVWVVDQAGLPVAGITVRLSYRNYSAEAQSHEVDVSTDANGHAAFAAGTLSASVVRRCLFTLLAARAGVHATFGRHASVFAFGDGREGYDIDPQRNILIDWTGKPDHMQSRIVVRLRSPA